MFYNKEELCTLNRKELQKLCKQFGIKANKKSSLLVDELCEYFINLQNEEKKLEDDLKNTENVVAWISDEEEEEKKSDKSEEMKKELMKEVNRRAEEKITKIPRFRADKVIVPNLNSPVVESFKKQHAKKYSMMDSIDVYLEKKRKRTEAIFSYQNKLKTEAECTLKKIKMTHNTPCAVATQVKKSLTKDNTPVRASLKSPMFKKSALKIDKDISFNFASKLKSPKHVLRTSPRNVNALKEKDTNTLSNVKKTPALKHKSAQFTSVGKLKAQSKPINRLNQTMVDLRSPSINHAAVTPNKKKTPVKFDLQTSLKKGLAYKPHSGKLKTVYFADRKIPNATQRGDANRTFTVSEQVSVKQLTKNTTTTEKRRATMANRRNTKRNDALNKRRGIAG